MASPTLFNVDFGNMVRHWLFLTMEYRAGVHYLLGHAVGQSLGVFYADDGLLGYWYLEWLRAP